MKPIVVLSPPQAAEFIGATVYQLKRWRCDGGGPKFILYGAHTVRYRQKDLETWVSSRPCFDNVCQTAA